MLFYYTVWFQLPSQWTKPSSVTIQMKVIEQSFPVVLFVFLFIVVLNFESVGETLKCDHLNETSLVRIETGAASVGN